LQASLRLEVKSKKVKAKRMNERKDLKERFYKFALRIVKLVRTLPKEVAAYKLDLL